jgi:hypothetical protein
MNEPEDPVKTLTGTFLEMIVQTLALRAALIDHKILSQEEVEGYCRRLRESATADLFRQSLQEDHLQAWMNSARIDRPIQ